MSSTFRVPLRISDLWKRFWYAEGSTIGLGLFRILSSVCLAWEVGITRQKSAYTIESGFHLPYVSWIQTLPPDIYRMIQTAQYPLILLIGLGLLTREATVVLLLLQGYVFFSDQLNFRNHPYLFLLLLLVLALAPADDALSLRAVIRSFSKRRPVRTELAGSTQPVTFQRLIQVQICIVYFYAALNKCNSAYLGGDVLSAFLSESLPKQLNGFIGSLFTAVTLEHLRLFLSQPENLVLPSVLSVATEFFLPFGLMWQRTRSKAFIIGILFHLTIGLTMNIMLFSTAVISSYVLFTPPNKLLTAWNRTAARGEISLGS